MNAELLVRMKRTKTRRERLPPVRSRTLPQLAAAQAAAAAGQHRDTRGHRVHLRAQLALLDRHRGAPAQLAALVEVASTAQEWIDTLLQRERRQRATREATQ